MTGHAWENVAAVGIYGLVIGFLAWAWEGAGHPSLMRGGVVLAAFGLVALLVAVVGRWRSRS